jgi:hypothetical protein
MADDWQRPRTQTRSGISTLPPPIYGVAVLIRTTAGPSITVQCGLNWQPVDRLVTRAARPRQVPAVVWTAKLGRNISRILSDGEPATDTYSVSDVFVAVALAVRSIEVEMRKSTSGA